MLSQATLGALAPEVRVPGYDRSRVSPGIVHIGVGNFHRVHQALVVEDLIEAGGHDQWGIVGVGLQPGEAGRAKAEAYRRQDGLYSVTEFASDGSAKVRVVGAIKDYVYAPDDPERVVELMARPQTRIVSLTITEGGYDLDKVLGEARAGGPPGNAFAYLVEALARRREAGLKPFTVMSCDNLRSNGETSKTIVLALAEARDAGLARWIAAEGAFPNSMVDRIAPTVTEEDRGQLRAISGIEDAVPAICESYTNWVMQDRFADGRPDFAKAGVSLRDDVADFEAVKGRLSNAAHMMLAYPGLMMGYRLVSEAMEDPLLARLLQAFWTRDAIQLVKAPPGFSVERFTGDVLDRFANRGIRDTLLRVAGDGASKLVVFHAKTLRQLIEAAKPLEREAFLFACFARYLRGEDDDQSRYEVFEPQIGAEEWAMIRSGDPEAVLKLAAFAELRLMDSDAFRSAFAEVSARLDSDGTRQVLSDLLS
jgi:mannitol-1-phosphate/altronate dehydrogenase